eukprot:scaffold6653_cov105-Phaeocystis_antarctica.AAC.2
MVHAPHTDRARPADTASETNASLCRGVGLSSASEEWEEARTNHNMCMHMWYEVEQPTKKAATKALVRRTQLAVWKSGRRAGPGGLLSLVEWRCAPFWGVTKRAARGVGHPVLHHGAPLTRATPLHAPTHVRREEAPQTGYELS